MEHLLYVILQAKIAHAGVNGADCSKDTRLSRPQMDTTIHSLLGLAGLQRKISITANNNSVTPERVRYRYYALETIRR